MCSNMEWEGISHKKANLPVIPHVVEPYRGERFKLSYADETLIFKSRKDLKKEKKRLSNLANKLYRKTRKKGKITSEVTQKIIQWRLIEYVEKKFQKGLHKWRKRGKTFRQFIVLWSYIHEKEINKAKDEYREEGIILSKDLVTGILKKEDLEDYAEKIDGNLERIQLVRDGRYYTDVKQRYRWSRGKVSEVKKRFRVPIPYVIKVGVDGKTGLLALVGKRIGILVAPVKK